MKEALKCTFALSLCIFFWSLLAFNIGCETNKSTSPVSEITAPISRVESKYSTLKQWTDEVLRWDESKIRAAVSNAKLRDSLPVNKIDYQELDRLMKLYADQLTQGALSKKANWLDQIIPTAGFFNTQSFGTDTPSEIDAETVYFGQKLLIPHDTSVVIMGDFHGSIHSFIRNLWRLFESGYLDNNFTISNKTHFVFTGDFVDRGRYSAEILYTLLRLKLANFDKVHLVRGNHETKNISSRYGLIDELVTKYGAKIGQRQFKDFCDLYRFFPVVLFMGAHDGAPRTLIHFSHGGISYNPATRLLLHSPARLIASDGDPFYELIQYPQHLGYMWTDFEQTDNTRVNTNRGFNNPEDGVVVAGRHALEQYAHEINSAAGVTMIGIFRGHQDMAFGFKLLFKDNPSAALLTDLAARNTIYPQGPFHWQHVISDPSEVSNARDPGIKLMPYRPVYTFTTASEGQGVPYDMYGILKLARDPRDFRLEIHEVALSNRVLERSYVTISPKTSPEDDFISASWAQDGPGRCLLTP